MRDEKNNVDKFGFARRGFGERVRELYSTEHSVSVGRK